ncbi:MAG: hypothetical protein AAF528_00840 [Cyanobacteria bacterium P01_C01_bin.121]
MRSLSGHSELSAGRLLKKIVTPLQRYRADIPSLQGVSPPLSAAPESAPHTRYRLNASQNNAESYFSNVGTISILEEKIELRSIRETGLAIVDSTHYTLVTGRSLIQHS